MVLLIILQDLTRVFLLKIDNLSEGVITDALLPLFEINIAGDTVSFNQTNVLANSIDYAWDFNGDGIVDSNEIILFMYLIHRVIISLI